MTDAAAATADAEGTIASIDDSTVTVNGAAVKYSAIYEISNNAAGATAVTKVTDLTALVGKTAKVYGDTVYLTFIAEPYTAPVSGTPGERTLKNYLQTAMNPVGTALYVYGGSWDWQDVNSSNQALTIGLPQSWIDFFQQQDANYTYKNSADPAHSYYPHNSWNQYYYAGVDCSAYIGWTVYNVMHTESTTNDLSDGYVMSAVKMAKTFADKGWGTWTRDIKSFKPGDIFSMSGHVDRPRRLRRRLHRLPALHAFRQQGRSGRRRRSAQRPQPQQRRRQELRGLQARHQVHDQVLPRVERAL